MIVNATHCKRLPLSYQTFHGYFKCPNDENDAVVFGAHGEKYKHFGKKCMAPL